MINPLNDIELQPNKALIQGWLNECVASYGMLDVTGKVVIDVGCDLGTSPYFFLYRGAAKVICYEADPTLYKILCRLAIGDERLELHEAWKGELPDGSVFKIDAEGSEYMLPDAVFTKYKQFAIALHPEFLSYSHYCRLYEQILKYGGQLSYKTEDGRELCFVKR